METSICLLGRKGGSPPTTINDLPFTTKLLGNPFCKSNFKQVIAQPTMEINKNHAIGII